MTVTLGKATRMADGSVVQHQFTMGQRAGAAFDNITVTHLQDATEVRARSLCTVLQLDNSAALEHEACTVR